MVAFCYLLATLLNGKFRRQNRSAGHVVGRLHRSVRVVGSNNFVPAGLRLVGIRRPGRNRFMQDGVAQNCSCARRSVASCTTGTRLCKPTRMSLVCTSLFPPICPSDKSQRPVGNAIVARRFARDCFRVARCTRLTPVPKRDRLSGRGSRSTQRAAMRCRDSHTTLRGASQRLGTKFCRIREQFSADQRQSSFRI